MSFRCQKCSTAKAPGTKPVKRVVETRQKTYMDRGEPIGFGFETVKELKLCEQCDGEMNEENS